MTHVSSCVFKATLIPPSLFPLNLWVASMIDTALSEWWCSVKLNCVCHLMKPPPRRPAVFAEQNESEEERQFRKVFQQLAGDVSAVLPSANSFSTVLRVLLLLLQHFCRHILESFSFRTWKWAQLSWWTSSTESFQDVGCCYVLDICVCVCVFPCDMWLITSVNPLCNFVIAEQIQQSTAGWCSQVTGYFLCVCAIKMQKLNVKMQK